MQRPVHHLCLVLSTVVLLPACSNDVCEEDPSVLTCGAGTTDGETGDGPENTQCVPLSADNPNLATYTYPCQGQGNGWLSLVVFGEGPLPPECVNWGPEGKPNGSATTDDCVPLDLTMLPNDIASPGACCIEDALEESVTRQCVDDCAYAACKLAVTKLRDAANALPDPDAMGLEKNAQERVKNDLFGFAATLETPAGLEGCANAVKNAEGEPAQVNLGAGMSDALLLGHVESAILTLQCALDEQPYTFEGESCEAPSNIPIVEEESSIGGVAALGAVTLLGPEGNTNVPLYDLRFAYTELRNRDGSAELELRELSAHAATTAYGSFVLHDPSLSLAAPARGLLKGEQVSFPPGALRLEVSASLSVDGQPMFEGKPTSGQYVNTGVATAIRGDEGSFALVEASFELGAYLFVLNTESGNFTSP